MFKGSITALVTPFRNGAIDKEALIKIVNWQIDQGIDGLVAAGTTGESPTLDHEEHREVIRIVVEAAAGRVPVIAGTGSNSTQEAIELSQFAADVKADGALIVTPYYNKPTQEGLFEHFKMLNDTSKIPIILYNIPGRSAVDISMETFGRLVELDKIIGLKDATGDIGRLSKQRLICGPDFIQLSGDDASSLGFNAHGGQGAISVTSNVVPALYTQFQDLTLSGDFKAALKIHERLMPLHHALFHETGVAGAKACLNMLGLCTNEVRLPLLAASEKNQADLAQIIKTLGILD